MRRRVTVAVLALLAAIAAAAAAQPAPAGGGDPIVVGSKNFAESRLLAEIFAQLLEERTDHVGQIDHFQAFERTHRRLLAWMSWPRSPLL
jgi:glycine betaine/choline ABC-type transport system substrate-binding protein